MRLSLTPLVVLVTAAIAAPIAVQAPPSPVPFVVHEWGTFTSIAAADGGAVSWLPQGGQSDLPCFVEHTGYCVKCTMYGTVRMETPVLYFYAPRQVNVDVKVGFKQGTITEWYPHAAVGGNGRQGTDAQDTIAWRDVTVSPQLAPAFPTENGESHYYKARNTDATPLQSSASQTEKFLFYRGVGQFAPPIAAAVQADGKTTVWTPGAPIGDVIMFENRKGAVAFEVHHVGGSRATLDRPSLEDTMSTPQRELVRILVASGLYPKEAEAMVDTWSDSWFEEGARLLYIVPRQAVDEIVPLTIAPAPSDVARVFVGRMELVTPVTRREVRTALDTGDRATLAKYGRFLRPIGERVIQDASPLDRPLLVERLQAVAPAWIGPRSSCK